MTKKTEDTTQEDIETKRARLLEELADLPAPETNGQTAPGTVVGTGPATDKIEYTHKWYQDNFPLKEIVPTEGRVVRVNGIGYQIFKGRKCFLPEPHYQAYLDALAAERQFDEDYAPPTNIPTTPGTMVTSKYGFGYRMGVGSIVKAEPNQ